MKINRQFFSEMGKKGKIKRWEKRYAALAELKSIYRSDWPSNDFKDYSLSQLNDLIRLCTNEK